MELSQMIFDLAGAVGVSGCEDGAAAVAAALLSPLGGCETTPLGSLICRIKTAPSAQPHLVLTAHLDEIGLIVTHIDEKGFLRVANCGGVDRATLPAAHVRVHTASGTIDGVVCSTPPHLLPDDEKLPKLEDLSVDIGMSGDAARAKVAPGDRVTIAFEPARLLGGRLCSKALDDRAGCAAVILAAQKLAEIPLQCSLSVLLATMEETGGQGSKTGAAALMPTHAIAVDVSYAHTPDAPRYKCGKLGEGVMIGIAPILDNGMSSRMIELAKRDNIPHQIEVMGGATGTDADQLVICGAGVRSGLLSIPLRYMHTPVEVIDKEDVVATADLMVAYAKDAFGGGHKC